MSVDGTLRTRRNTHGDYFAQSCVSMGLLTRMETSENWKHLDPDQREALILIALKIGRILTGNIREADHWHDIAGYAQLVENRINGYPSNGALQAAADKAGYVASLKEAARQAAQRDPPGQVASPSPWHIDAGKVNTGTQTRDSSCGPGWSGQSRV